MIKKIFLLFCCLSSLSFVLAQDDYPYIARVTGSHVNARAGAGLDFPVLIQIKKGEMLTVLGKQEEWLKIQPPEGTRFWIYSRMLKNGWPKEEGVHVRSGRGTHFPIICDVGPTTSIDILSEQEGWTQIAPPQNSAVWVYADYVAFFSSPENYSTKLEIEQKSKALFEKAEQFREEQLRQKMDEIQFDVILAKYQAILDQYPESPWVEQAKARLADTQRKQEVAVRELKKRGPVLSKQPLAQKKELLSFDGRIRPYHRPDSLFTHRLYGGFLSTQSLCLLAASDIDLSSYQGKQVRVWGTSVRNQENSGIQVERIELIR